jgi:hypothetical protein
MSAPAVEVGGEIEDVSTEVPALAPQLAVSTTNLLAASRIPRISTGL